MTSEKLRFLNRRQSREVDRLAIEAYGVPALLLMENAAIGCTQWLAEALNPSRVLIVSGAGNNGGDGLAIGRHLVIRGVDVCILLAADVERMSAETAVHFEISRKLALPMTIPEPPGDLQVRNSFAACCQRFQPELIVDALLGTGLQSPPRPPLAALIEQINGSRNPVVSIDVPSGWDCDSGRPWTPCVRARWTLTMAAPKLGFDDDRHREFIGEWIPIRLGIPDSIVEQAAASVA